MSVSSDLWSAAVQLVINVPWALAFLWLLKYVMDDSKEREAYYRQQISVVVDHMEALTTAINTLCSSMKLSPTEVPHV